MLFLLPLFLLPQPLLAQEAGEVEEVMSFLSEIIVDVDGTATVTETIDYFFPHPRHGIFRDLPLRYEMDDGQVVIVPLEVLSVEGGPYELQGTKSNLRIKIGDPNRTVTGPKHYVITYEVSGALRYFSDHDELFWNVTGHGWEVPLREVRAEVTLPKTVDSDSFELACLTGPLGSRDSDCQTGQVGRTANFLTVGGPLTVVVGWGPKGAVAVLEARHPNFWQDWFWPNLGGLVAVVLLPLLTGVTMYRRWRRQGRDPSGQGTLVVQYDPPDKLTPAEVGTIDDERADVRDVSATFVDLAVRGHLKIVELPKKMLQRQDYRFVLLKEGFREDKSLKEHELKVLKVLFGPQKETTLNELVDGYKFHKVLPLIKKRLYGQVVAGGYFAESPEVTRSKHYAVGIAVMVLGFIVLAVLGQGLLAGLVRSNFFLVGAGLVVSGAVIMIFGARMPRRTEKGVRALDHSRGFREYLQTAERYRLKWQEDEHMFERFLPYAMIFGVVDKWTEAFKDVALEPPDWYEGQSLAGGFNAVAFYGALGGLESGLSRAVSSSPQKSSSGSGFGGSSGGGFGGGGGGSW